MRPGRIVVIRNVVDLCSGRLQSLVSLGVFISTRPSRHLLHIVAHSVIRHNRPLRVLVSGCQGVLGPVRSRFVRPAGRCTSVVVPGKNGGRGTVRVLGLCVRGVLKE